MNELAAVLDESVTRLFEDLVTRDVLEEAEEGAWPDRLWRALVDNGLTHALVSSDVGGVGAEWSEVQVVLRAAGRHCTPVPLAEMILAGWLCSKAEIDIPKGVLTVAPRSDLTLEGGRVRGELQRVPWGIRSDAVLTEVEHDGQACFVLLETDQAEVESGRNLAREPRDRLRFKDAKPLATAPVPESIPSNAVVWFGALVRSVQMAGALEHLLSECVKFANDRVQFGRPIGKFQAIQHQLAVLASETAAASAASDNASRFSNKIDPRFEIAVAKMRVGEAAGIGARIAHGVHGAIGFTYEHALHFATRRLWSWRAEFGADGEWARWLGKKSLNHGSEELWPFITAR